jgi:hypothetical protein
MIKVRRNSHHSEVPGRFCFIGLSAGFLKFRTRRLFRAPAAQPQTWVYNSKTLTVDTVKEPSCQSMKPCRYQVPAFSGILTVTGELRCGRSKPIWLGISQHWADMERSTKISRCGPAAAWCVGGSTRLGN